MFRPTIVATFMEVFFEGHSRWPKNVGGYADHNKSTKLDMHLLVISNKKSSMPGRESFKIYS